MKSMESTVITMQLKKKKKGSNILITIQMETEKNFVRHRVAAQMGQQNAV